MLTPKGSHLVERVAERLLSSAATDGSAARLLRQPATPAPDEAGQDPKPPPPPPGAARPRRVSLFAPSPASAPPHDSQWRPDGEEPVTKAAPAGSPPSHGRSQSSGQAAVLELPPSDEPSGGRLDALADAASGLPRGPLSIDSLSLERAGMLDWSHTRTRISEEFRLIQRQIIRSAFGPNAEPGFSNLLLVTSARPGEGKSFVAANLAGSIARQGDHPVLLVDTDSKRSSVCASLGLAQARGLLDLAADPALDATSLMVGTPIERLSILPVGRERERSAELFSTKEMTRLIQSLGRRYADRLLILDASPCLSTSDAAVLAQVVGQILFVVEADRTQRNEVEASLDLVQACPSITMILNKQQISSRHTFGAYSSYYAS